MTKTFPVDISGAYVRDIFRINGPMGSFRGADTYLDWDNCQIFNKSLNKNGIILHLKNAAGDEARAYIDLKDEFKDYVRLFKSLFVSERAMGCTLNQLNDLKIEEL